MQMNLKSIRQRLEKEKRIFHNRLMLAISRRKEFNPVFLIGCARSGTTVLGRTLSNHQEIAYLNEDRILWRKAYPEFDVWSHKSASPKVLATAKDHSKKASQVLADLFYGEQNASRATVLLEKLPINSFRLEFLSEAFPKAKYIYLHRNGLEVARSIKKKADAGQWFGKRNLKWLALEKLAHEENLSIENLGNYEKGLIEWRFSTKMSENFFEQLPSDQYFALSYESLLKNPVKQLQGIFDYLGLKTPETLTREWASNFKRSSEVVQEVTERDVYFGGPNLKKSVHNKFRHTLPLVTNG